MTIDENTNKMIAGMSKIQVHVGNAIMLASKLYPTLPAAALEIVQNAIDSNAKNISVKLDRKKRSLTVFDDGDGADIEKFNLALGSVGQSSKNTDKFGRYGYGLVSPIDKCEVMTFTSCPRGEVDSYIEWIFRATDILTQRTDINIPYATLSNFRFGKETKTLTIDSKTVSQVTWRTKVSLKNYSTDREIGKIGSLDDLAKEIFSRFGTTMHKEKIKLHLEFTDEKGATLSRKDLRAPEYTGQRLGEFIDNAAGVRTTFRLFLAKGEGRKGKSNGVVVVGEANNPFRFPFKVLANNCEEFLSTDVMKALKSGIFEGEIFSAAVSLHPNRKQFNINEGLTSFNQALQKWYLEVGAQHMETVQDSRQGERYQQLGRESMQNIANLFKSPRFSHLAELLRYLPHGTVGKEHSKVDPIVGQQENPSQSQQKPGTASTPKKAGTEEKTPVETPKTREDHHPLTVAGPKGQKRHIVEGGSFGLQFSYEKMPGEERLWIFDDLVGILRFNVRHPTWVTCETSDRRIMQLQELVAVQAVNWFFEPDDMMKIALLRVLESAIDQQAFMLVHSDSFNIGTAKKIEVE